MSDAVPISVGGSGMQRSLAGGHAWALAHWAIGVRHLGYPVTFLDRRENDPVQPPLQALVTDGGANYVSIDDEMHTEDVAGPGVAGALLNIMGFVPTELRGGAEALRVFVDIDPGYPQMWRELGLVDMLAGHDRFVTIGENVGRSDSSIPDCGVEWITTAPPIVLAAWPVAGPGSTYTTVATWRNDYGTVTWNGETYGSRVHEFRQFFELPRLVDAEFELALDIDAAEVDDLRALEANGWRLVDPKAVAGMPNAYRSYIQSSRAEFSVAQNMYVATRSGWLSDRSLCYLASGKPVLAQDTGFSDNYPVGEGLIAFTTLEEAAVGVEEIERNYDRHSRAARGLAEEYFDSAKVLRRLLDRLGIQEVAQA